MNMTKKWSIDKAFRGIVGLAFDAVLIISVIAVFLCVFYPDDNNVTELSGSWVDETGAPILLGDFNRYDSKTDTMLPQRIYYRTEIKNIDTSLIFRARNCFVNVYINGVLLHEDYRKNAWFYGRSPGSRWHCVSLDSSTEPVTLCLEVTACYANSDGFIDSIYLGNTKNVYEKVISKRFAGFFISIFLQLCGVIILLLYAYMHKHYKTGLDLLYLGNATFFSAQWSGTETLLWQLLVGHSEMFHLLGYISLVAIPVSYGMLAYHRLGGKLKIFSQIYSLVSAVAAITLTALHLFGIVEFHDSLFVIHILLGILIPLMVPLVLSYMNEHSKKTNYAIIFPLLSVLVVCIGISLIKYNMGMYDDYSDYVRLALLCFLFCLMVYQFRQIVATYSNGMRADVLADLALTDYMTGLYNRTAFNAHIDEYDHIIASFSPLGIIQFDVNNLKTVNDTLGHEKGDMMIKAVADGLRYAFEEYQGACRSYRTGGDEFLTIINAINADEIYEKCIARLMEYCDEFNKQPDLGFTLTIAHGYVLIKGGKTLSEAIDEADALMYENKRMLKGLV